jgi:hypothetical protein
MKSAVIFGLGWLLFVAAQAQNSVRSKTNNLSGWSGLSQWLKGQAVNVITRAFFSYVFYGWVIQFVTAKVQAAGIGNLTAMSIAGTAGYSANALLYQIFGFLPWLRVEVQDLAPPASAQIVPAPPEKTRDS